MRSFNIGDKIIYPNHGLGVIEDIQMESYFGQEFRIYHVRIVTNGTLVLVPSSNADEIGIRRPVSGDSVEQVFGFLKTGEVDVSMNWKGRFREHTDLMKSGEVLDVAYVLKSLFYLNLLKPLSFREKKMMEKAKDLIVSELSIASSLSSQAIEHQLMDHLSCWYREIAGRTLS